MEKYENVILPAFCSLPHRPHEPHSGRYGLLGLGKWECPGFKRPRLNEKTKEEIWDRIKPPEKHHRHFYKLTRVIHFKHSFWNHFVEAERIAWQCECGSWRASNKIDLYEEMIPNRWNGVDQLWPS
jgi:hypothetical protein